MTLSKRSATNGWREAPQDFLPLMTPRLPEMAFPAGPLQRKMLMVSRVLLKKVKVGAVSQKGPL